MMPRHPRFLIVGAAGLVLVYYLFLPTVQKDLSKSSPGNTLAQVAAATYPNDNSPLGTNLNGVSYFVDSPFINVFKSSNAWVTSSNTISNTGEQSKLDLDQYGWVRSLTPINGQTASYTKVSALMLRSLLAPYFYKGGQYIALYDGEGTINYRFDARKNAALSTPGRDVLDVVPTGAGIQIEITATDPNRTGNYIRNIRIFHSSRESLLNSGEIFDPDFIEKIKKYRALRFMNWMRTTEGTESSWTARPKETDPTYGSIRGVPLEVMIKLSNKLHADPWFSIPHLTDNNYSQNFAQMVKDQLDTSLKVYVEHSNEVWNGNFPASGYAVAQGAAQNPPITGLEYHALRTKQIGDIFKGVLGSRSVTVFGAQAAGRSTAINPMDYLKNKFSAHGIDAIAIAPYFGVVAKQTDAATYQAMSLDQLFDFVRNNTGTPVLPASITFMNNYRTIGNTYGTDIIAYEGGQHMVVANGVETTFPAVVDLFTAFNRDPRIKQMYLDYFNAWKQSGNGLFMHFLAIGECSINGCWGALESMLQPRSPKHTA